MGSGGRIILRRCGDVSGGNARFVPLGGSRLLQAVGKAFEKMQHQLAIIFRQTSDGGVHMVRLVEEARAAFGQQFGSGRSEEHTSELQSHYDLVCRLLLEKKKNYVQKK